MCHPRRIHKFTGSFQCLFRRYFWVCRNVWGEPRNWNSFTNFMFCYLSKYGYRTQSGCLVCSNMNQQYFQMFRHKYRRKVLEKFQFLTSREDIISFVKERLPAMDRVELLNLHSLDCTSRVNTNTKFFMLPFNIRASIPSFSAKRLT